MLESRDLVDLLDAFAVEDQIVKLPPNYRRAIKLWHVTKLDVRWIAKRCHVDDVGQLMRDAWALLEARLDGKKERLV